MSPQKKVAKKQAENTNDWQKLLKIGLGQKVSVSVKILVSSHSASHKIKIVHILIAELFAQNRPSHKIKMAHIYLIPPETLGTLAN